MQFRISYCLLDALVLAVVSLLCVLRVCLRYPEEVTGTTGVTFTSLLRDLGIKDEMSARYVEFKTTLTRNCLRSPVKLYFEKSLLLA